MENPQKLTLIAQNFLYYDVNASPTRDVTIFGVGYERCAAGKMEGPKTFSHYSMHVVLSGRGVLRIDGREYAAYGNQIFMLPPNAELVYYPDSLDPWEYIWCNFSGPNAVKLCLRCNLTPESPIFTAVTPEIVAVAKSLTELHKNKFSLDIATIGCFYELFALMIEKVCREQASEHSVGEHSILAAIEYIRDNYADYELNLTSVAAYVGLHFNYFSQLFKRVTGCTFNHYLNLFRIQKACELLDLGEKYIRSVAERVGYPDQLYFSKVFKKYKGVSPRYYRAEIQSV